MEHKHSVQLYICAQTAEVTDALCQPTQHLRKLHNSSASSALGPSTLLEELMQCYEKMWHPQAQSGAAAGFCAGGSKKQLALGLYMCETERKARRIRLENALSRLWYHGCPGHGLCSPAHPVAWQAETLVPAALGSSI
jgi:hypothetical protein